MYIFISHSSKEADIANGLCEAIENAGEQCFIAPRDIRTGYEYAAEIAEGIDRSDILILLLSKAANASPHVLREVERAVTKHIPVLVYKLEDVTLSKSMEYFLMTHQWLNAKKDDYTAVIDSLSSIKKGDVVTSGDNSNKSRKKVIFNIIKFAVVFVLFCASVIVVLSAVGIVGGSKDIEETTESTEYVAETKPSIPPEDAVVGNTIFLGKYNNEPIEWMIINKSEDSKTAVLVSKYVLCFKGFSAPEAGSYSIANPNEADFEEQAFCMGNNSWEDSTIRQWLNSDALTVEYEGQAPVAEAFADIKNGYEKEPGFLNGFSDVEKAAIIESAVTTNGTVLSKTNTVTTYDKVFLLSKDEFVWFENAGLSVYAEPTKAAINKNETFWYRDYCTDCGYKATSYWLRDPLPNSSTQCYLADYGHHDGQIFPWETGVESFGIRPVITVDLSAEGIRIE